MKRNGLALGLAFTFGLTVLSGAAWAGGPRASHGGFHVRVHSGHVKLFIGRGHHHKFKTQHHHKFRLHKFKGHGHFRQHQFKIHRQLRHHGFHARFRHHGFHHRQFRSHGIVVHPVPKAVWGPGSWQRNGEGASGTRLSRFDQGFVIIDATPLHAQVFLDRRLLGSTRQVVARAFPLPPGRHIVEVVAPGFRPYRTEFTIDPTFSTRLHVALQPE